MSGKRIPFGPKPKAETTVITPAIEEWVESRNEVQTKRLTLEIPAELHRRVKSQCAARGTKMIDEITSLLDQHFPR
jgi:hypothetical protein